MLVNVEQGEVNPSVGTLLRLSDALGVGLPALVQPPQSEPPEGHPPRAGAQLCGRARPADRGFWSPGPVLPMSSSSGTGRWPPASHTPVRRIHREPGNWYMFCRARSPSRAPARAVTLHTGDAVSFFADSDHRATPTTQSGPHASRSRCSNRESGPPHSPRRTRDDRRTRAVLAAAHVDAAVFALRPDYRALLLAGRRAAGTRSPTAKHCWSRPNTTHAGR